MKHFARLETPVGTLGICATETHITKIFREPETALYEPGTAPYEPFNYSKGVCRLYEPGTASPETEDSGSVLNEAIRQLREYFDGKRHTFELPLEPEGTEFQKKVWKALQEIPHGETRTYRDIAVQVGNPKAARAVGSANHRNPVMLVIPCHRVIGADGSLTGYAAGLDAKRFLLDYEKEQTGINPAAAK